MEWNSWRGIFLFCKDQSSKLLQDPSGHSKALAQLLNAEPDTARHRPGLLGALLRSVLLLVPSDSDSTDHLYLSICIFFRCSLHFELGTFGIAWYYCLRVLSRDRTSTPQVLCGVCCSSGRAYLSAVRAGGH